MYRPHATTPLLLGAFALAVACGPRTSGGSGGSGDASGGTADGDDSSETLTGATSTGGASVTVGSSADSSSSGGAGGCVDNVANEPWCYRAFAVDAAPDRGLFGRFGPGGEYPETGPLTHLTRYGVGDTGIEARVTTSGIRHPASGKDRGDA
ncbi:MAG: hypothetical protein IPH07_09330 [Deltaproteobacteria bacterium]|nr:hypothetical protein [Deltaproteobacteria bacterium]MBK8236937.1 hypothetical protein [Deltaproteobacteria bacterium]MBP7289813.1 hypothetical protein [Nannocystaceae bacterium]